MRADQPCLTIPDVDVAFGQLRTAISQAFNFPAFERQAGFEPVLDEVVVTGPLVGGNYVALVGLLFAHLGRIAVGVEEARLYGIVWGSQPPHRRERKASVVVTFLNLYENLAIQRPQG